MNATPHTPDGSRDDRLSAAFDAPLPSMTVDVGEVVHHGRRRQRRTAALRASGVTTVAAGMAVALAVTLGGLHGRDPDPALVASTATSAACPASSSAASLAPSPAPETSTSTPITQFVTIPAVEREARALHDQMEAAVAGPCDATVWAAFSVRLDEMTLRAEQVPHDDLVLGSDVASELDVFPFPAAYPDRATTWVGWVRPSGSSPIATAISEDPATARLRITAVKEGGGFAEPVVLPARGTGPLRLVVHDDGSALQGLVLTYADTSGDTFRLDVASGAWLDGGAEPAPATGIPTAPATTPPASTPATTSTTAPAATTQATPTATATETETETETEKTATTKLIPLSTAAGSSASPHTITLAPGILAATGTFTGSDPTDVSLGTWNGAAVDLARFGNGDAGTELIARMGSDKSSKLAGDTTEMGVKAARGDFATVGRSVFDEQVHGAIIWGNLPPDLPHARVYLWFKSATGTPRETLTVVELPTFHLPAMAPKDDVDDGNRPWFAAQLVGTGLSSEQLMTGDVVGVVYAQDGTVTPGGASRPPAAVTAAVRHAG